MRVRCRRVLRLAVPLLLGVAVAMPVTAGAHHALFIREVRPSHTLTPALAFVELQMYAQGQTRLTGALINTYNAAGTMTHTYALPSDPANGQGQRSVLIGASGLAGTADYVDAGLAGAMTPAGGAVCFPEAAPPDCVSWGTFAGGLPFPGAGTPAPAVPDGMSLERTILRDCRTALDSADDSNNSAADFTVASPSPRSNATAPTEVECLPCRGRTATVAGTDGADKLVGTPGADVIVGASGADTLKGLGGNDVICGGRGKDRLVGGRGRDELSGQRGRDTCVGGPGADSGRSCEATKSL